MGVSPGQKKSGCNNEVSTVQRMLSLVLRELPSSKPYRRYITNSKGDSLPAGLIAQLVEHCSNSGEVMGSNPVQDFFS